MSMTPQADIAYWFEGTQLYDCGDIEGALTTKFREVTENSRILFNIGCCFLTTNDIKAAAKDCKLVNQSKKIRLKFLHTEVVTVHNV